MAQITFTNTGGITATGALSGSAVYSNGTQCLTAAITSLATGSSGSGNVVTDITVSGNTITKVKGITALTGISAANVTGALGYTPLSTTGKAASAGSADSAGSVPWTGVSDRPTDLSQFNNTGAGYITGISASNVTGALGYVPLSTTGKAASAGSADSAGSVPWTGVSNRPTGVSAFTNDAGYLTGISSSQVTGALGYTPVPTTRTVNSKALSSDITLTYSDVGALKDYGNDNSRPNGTTFTMPGSDNPVQMRSTNTSGLDIGIFYLTDDVAMVCNSGDRGYVFGAFNTDQTADFSNVNNASFAVLESNVGVKMKGTFTIDNKASMSYNSTTESIDFNFS